ncbi:MAG: hypothetical protein ACKO40_15725 [Planctomycetaceae bacterium]
MGLFLFFLFAIVAGLLWTAACTAAAARATRPWLKALLVALGTSLPVIAMLPIVAATWWLAFGMRVQPSWFPHALTVLVSLLLGGGWIVRAGLASRGEGTAPAARWPIIGLTALAVIAAAVTAGVLLILDNAVVAQSPYLRLEAANLVRDNLPPIVADADNAAPLHLQAAAAIAADEVFSAEGSPVHAEGDVLRDDVTAFLDRHATTLDLVRRAADRDTCRFTRDWSRPSIDMILAEIQALRSEGRLLALAARRAAAEGRHADALADIVRIHRIGRHAAAEPILVSYLVGISLDSVALAALVDILPRLGAADAPLLDSPAVRDLVGRPFDLLPALYGEEAFGLSTFAGFADGRVTPAEFLGPDQAADASMVGDIDPLFRVFFLERDIAGYRQLMHDYQQLAARRDESASHAETIRQAESLERTLEKRQGMLSRLLFPALKQVFLVRGRAEAAHRAAAALVAATKQRLQAGTLPLGPGEFSGTPPYALPSDPFMEGGKAIVMKKGDAGIVAYSVGPDGADDGGPTPRGEETAEGNDDVGFVMAVR